MSEKKHDLVATGTSIATTDGTVVVKSGSAMPPDEPGHKGAEINAGATPFDPNAARRFAEGRGPGMQDSRAVAAGALGAAARRGGERSSRRSTSSSGS
jgi:hypothetical protein